MLLHRCHCNPDHNKFSSLSNTTVVAIFPKHCLWRRSLFSNLGGIHPEKLYRATLKRSAKFHLLIQSCHLRDLFFANYLWMHNYCFLWNYFVFVIDHFEFVKTIFKSNSKCPYVVLVLFIRKHGGLLGHFPFNCYTSGADLGFFLGGGALVPCSTSTPINHIVFFFAEYQLY